MARTAILGATGYIGESLARRWSRESPDTLALFARRPEVLTGWPEGVEIRSIEDFDAAGFDLVINAVGAGDPARVGALGDTILEVTRQWDERVLGRLRPDGRYVFLSSGAVHAADPQPAYTLSKREAERLHRSLEDRAILDLRVFGYAEHNIKLDASFFLAELAASVAARRPFRTNRADMVRDYAGAEELKALIDAWLGAEAPNAALDLYSLKSVSKLELLELAQAEFGMAVEWVAGVATPPTGHKPAYASNDHAAEKWGYHPKRSSLEIVRSLLDQVAVA